MQVFIDRRTQEMIFLLVFFRRVRFMLRSGIVNVFLFGGRFWVRVGWVRRTLQFFLGLVETRVGTFWTEFTEFSSCASIVISVFYIVLFDFCRNFFSIEVSLGQERIVEGWQVTWIVGFFMVTGLSVQFLFRFYWFLQFFTFL